MMWAQPQTQYQALTLSSINKSKLELSKSLRHFLTFQVFYAHFEKKKNMMYSPCCRSICPFVRRGFNLEVLTEFSSYELLDHSVSEFSVQFLNFDELHYYFTLHKLD